MKFDDKVKAGLAKFYGWLPKKLTGNQWLMESIGVFLVCVPLVKLFSYASDIHWVQAGLAWAIFQWLNVEYEERWDPNGWQEGVDVIMRLLISTLALVLYTVIF